MEPQNRNTLASYFFQLGFKVGAEVGVLGGSYSAMLCKCNPDLKLFCIDSWGMGENKKKPYHLRKWEEAKIRLAPYDTKLIHKFSMDAVKDFADGSLDFVYIDANHDPKFVSEDIAEWSKKVKFGGIVSGHDYALKLAEVVDNFIKINSQELHLTTETNEPISWWYIKK